MSNALSLACSCDCGQVRATLTPRPDQATRCVCFCRDCRAFAHALDHAGQVLDERGGTEVIQMVPGALHFDQGEEHVALMQLSEGGLFRWYTDCCRSPIGNTLRTNRFPFIGVIDSFLTEAARAELQRQMPLHAHVYTQFAHDAPAGEARRRRGDEQPKGGTGLVMRRFAKIVLNGWFHRAARRSALFDDRGKPMRTPKVLAAEERRRIATLG